MQFTHPEFLYGLLFILIPIFIHLFNFRRYRTAYFSNVKLLQHLVTQTKRESQIKQWVVLFLRVLGIAALVIAFAQPYIPNENETKSGSLITIFIDNSFSMDAESQNGTFLNEATDVAKNIVNAYSYDDDFLLVTQELSGKMSHVLNKDEILEKIDEVQISNYSHSWNDVLSFLEKASQNSLKEQKNNYFISDFQDNYDLEPLKKDTLSTQYILQVGAKELNNVSVDSCWFMTPVLKQGYQVTLMVRISNYSQNDIQKLPVRLYINGSQVTSVPVDVRAQSFADVPLNYTIHNSGVQKGKLEINDAPITFDDQLFFTYNVSEEAKIVVIQEEENRYLSALYEKDSVFSCEVMNLNSINYSHFGGSQLVVLDQVKSISTGLSDELQKYVNAGGNILVFPSAEMDPTSWSTFLSAMEVPVYNELVNKEVRIGKINYESVYFKDAIEQGEERLSMPMVTQYFNYSVGSGAAETILTLENGAQLLTGFQVGTGRVVLSAVAMNDNFGAAHKNAIFFIPLHNIGILSQINMRLYNTLGHNLMQVIPLPENSNVDLFTMRSESNGTEFVPEQRTTGKELMLYFHDQVQESGFYDLVGNEQKMSTLAFNFNRAESNLSYHTDKEIEQMIEESNGKIQPLDVQTKDLTQEIQNKMQGKQLWRYFIFSALLAFLLEVLLLRFWGRNKVKS